MRLKARARKGSAVRIPYSSPSTARSDVAQVRTLCWNTRSSSKIGVGKVFYFEVMSDRYAGREY